MTYGSTTATEAAPAPDLRNVEDVCAAFTRSVEAHPDREALRSSDRSRSLTWRQFDEEVRALAAGLLARGLQAGDTIGLLLTNRVEAQLADMGALFAGLTPTAFYNTSSPEQLTSLIEDSEVRLIISEKSLAERARAGIAASGREVPVFLVDGTDGDPLLEDLARRDAPLTGTARLPDGPDSVAVLIYTSGTTGEPKGVEITHRNILSAIRSLNDFGTLPLSGTAFSFLPFAHIGDRTVNYYTAIAGGLTIVSHPNPRDALFNLSLARPSVLQGVPRVIQQLGRMIEEEAVAAGFEADLARTLELGARIRAARVEGRDAEPAVRAEWERLRDTSIADIRFRLGIDQLDMPLTGAAPLAVEILHFFEDIGMPIYEVYGSSETTGIVLSNPIGATKPGTVGIPIPGVEVKLGEDSEMLLRGPSITRGYRNKPEMTAATIDSDGWLHTGDIATIDDDGYVRIVDRKKELIILSNGKNLAPSHIENTMMISTRLLSSIVCVSEGRSYNAALAILSPEAASALTGSTDVEENARSPLVREALRTAVRSGNERLNGPEQIKRVIILPETWLPGGDALTATSKLRRRVIDKAYADRIDELYAGSPNVLEIEERRSS